MVSARGAVPVAADELRRLGGAGVLLLAALAVVESRLVLLQVFSGSDTQRTVSRKVWTDRDVPGRRDAIVDRHGELLAFDRAVCEVRIEVRVPRAADAVGPVIDRLARDLFVACAQDSSAFGGLSALDELRESVRVRAWNSWRRAARRANAAHAERVSRAEKLGKKAPKPPYWVVVEFLVHRAVDSAVALESLRRHDFRRMTRRERSLQRKECGYKLLAVHEVPRYERVHPEKELTAGFVGVLEGGRPVTGLEADEVTQADGTKLFRRVDALQRPYWSSLQVQASPPGVEPRQPRSIRLTVDLGLQRMADRLLVEAAQNVADQSRFEGPPEWGAMVLVEVETGDILAMASYVAGPDGERAPYGAFAPLQRASPPGSVVKPLHIALGLEKGVVEWGEFVDCGPLRFGSRSIIDSHPCGDETPYGVLLNSSNIGAVRLGMRLGAEGLDDYLTFYGFGRPLNLGIRNENPGFRRCVAGLSVAQQERWVGPSVCFGYEIRATPLQIARSFLSLVSGRSREMRLLADNPLPPRGPRILSARQIRRVTSALVGVVDGKPGSTARRVARMLDKMGVPKGTIAGKTGTSEFTERWVERSPRGEKVERVAKTRTASFAGYAPAHDPRYLAVGVLQKRGANSFYGGSYTGPYVVQLLLRALAEEPDARR